MLPLTSLECSLAAWPHVYTAVFLGKYFYLRATKQSEPPLPLLGLGTDLTQKKSEPPALTLQDLVLVRSSLLMN